MPISTKFFLLILALVCFALAFFNTGRYSWTNGGYFFTLLYFTV